MAPGVVPPSQQQRRPDGDTEVDPELDPSTFNLIGCPSCGERLLKPAVTLFGDNVPQVTLPFPQLVGSMSFGIAHQFCAANCLCRIFQRVAEESKQLADEADGLLVVGSSMTTFSAFRLAKKVHENGKPIAVITIGETRVDPLANLKVEGRCGETLSRLSSALAAYS